MLPEQGMTKYDILSRSSLIFVQSKHQKKKFHLIAPLHVTHPWLFTHFYPQEWLQFVTEKSVKNFLGFRELQSGKLIKEFELSKKTYKSSNYDFIVLHLENEQEVLEYLKKINLYIYPIQLLDNINNIDVNNEDLILIGHSLEGEGEEESKVLIPVYSKGKINIITDQEVFIKTNIPSVMGMCGGPVITKNEQKCIGTIASLIYHQNFENCKDEVALKYKNKDIIWKDIHLNTLIIPSTILLSFLNDIEKSWD